MPNGLDPIADDELLYRRVPLSWYDAATGLNDQAFAPHKERDKTGLSVTRAKYKTINDAAKGTPGKSYYIAVLRAGDLRNAGIEVEPRPGVDDPGHTELPQLNAQTCKDDITLERQRALKQLCVDIAGPFVSELRPP